MKRICNWEVMEFLYVCIKSAVFLMLRRMVGGGGKWLIFLCEKFG